MRKKILIGVGVVMLVILLLSSSENDRTQVIEDIQINQSDITERYSYMGFGTWPPEATLSGLERRNQFITDYADITLIHLDNGVPWQESLDGGEYNAAVTKKWQDEKNIIPTQHKILVAINPLNMDRSALALGWGENENTSLDGVWKEVQLNSQEVKDAFLVYAKRTIDFFDPDYFAFSIEGNEILEKNPETWEEYKELHTYLYTELSREYPHIDMFGTFVYRDRIVPESDREWLKTNNDILVLSTHPHVHGRRITNSYFDDALEFEMQIAISESGLPSKSFKAFGSQFNYTETDQNTFISLVLDQAVQHKFEFIINWANIDFDGLLDLFPRGSVRDLASLWAYTGLQNGSGEDKQALDTWKRYLNAPYR